MIRRARIESLTPTDIFYKQAHGRYSISCSAPENNAGHFITMKGLIGYAQSRFSAYDMEL
jgi:hypothetical protein